MTAIYFLDGLGSNVYYTEGLSQALKTKGIDFYYLSYPEAGFSSLADLCDWFEQKVSADNIILMGFSLGADFATYLAQQFSTIKCVILLDGGLHVHPIDSVALKEEIEQAKAYLSSATVSDMVAFLEKEQTETPFWKPFLKEAILASYAYDGHVYRLTLSEQAVTGLLTTRRSCFESSKLSISSIPTLVCLAGQPEEYCCEKVARLRDYPEVVVHVCQTASHNLYLEAETELVDVIQGFLGVMD